MKFVLTSPYGALEEFRGGRKHLGIDIATPEGTELRTLFDGTVSKILNLGDKSLGKAVFIEYDSGVTGVYGHMSKFADIKIGQHLEAGQTIGYSGNTGFSTGAHLHYAEKINNSFVDPTQNLERLQQMTGGNNGFWRGALDKYNDFADKVIGKEMEVGSGFLEGIGNTIGKEIVQLFYKGLEIFTLNLPEIMGVVTFVVAGLIMFNFKPRKAFAVYCSLLGGAVLWLINASS